MATVAATDVSFAALVAARGGDVLTVGQQLLVNLNITEYARRQAEAQRDLLHVKLQSVTYELALERRRSNTEKAARQALGRTERGAAESCKELANE